MKTLSILFFLLFTSLVLVAQHLPKQDTIVPRKGNIDKQLIKIKTKKIKLHSDSIGNEPLKSKLIDTTLQNKYGDLLNDDEKYNIKYPVWMPITEVFVFNISLFSVDKYVFNYDFSSNAGFNSWKYNLKTGWEWDEDRFGMNFILHPYTGNSYFNVARSSGYNYFQSFKFAIAGSLMWEYFGENTRPSYNDIINTSVNGAFLGEILFRLSSNILDDRTRGRERVFREILAGIIDPVRGANRLIQGKTFRRTNKEVYQKEPLNLTFYAGLHKINDGLEALNVKTTASVNVNIQFDYGNPFENRIRKAFDFFKIRTEFDFGNGRKFLSNVSGYGILTGKNLNYMKQSMLIGLFQYSDYWDNRTFELGTVGFGLGAFSKLRAFNFFNLYTNLNLAFVPFAGNSRKFSSDTAQSRDYIFGYGIEGKFESTLNISKYATASIAYYYFVIRSYAINSGINYIGILKPRFTVHIYKNLSIGFEDSIYYNDRFVNGAPFFQSVRTEQKIFLELYLEDKQRRGHYN